MLDREPPLPTPHEMGAHVFRLMIFLAALYPIYWITHTSESWPKRIAVVVVAEGALLLFWRITVAVLRRLDPPD